MIHEYAVEPKLLNRWSDFRYYVSQFGFDRGRLISLFPKKKWKRLVYQSLGDCREVERKKIEEALRRIDDRLIPRRAERWNDQADWLSNAESEHEHRPFRAILAVSNDRSHPAVIVGSSIDDTVDLGAIPDDDPRRLWKACRSRIVNRNASDMADVVDTFMRHAVQILFVDKHFGPENARHRIPFQEFLSRLDGRLHDSVAPVVEVHCARVSEPSFFRNECEARLASLIPEDVTVRFFRWRAEDLHNRFILTNLGGVAFLEGLDQFEGKGRRDDVAVLLDTDVAKQLMQDFSPASSRFKQPEQFEVRGRCPRGAVRPR